MKTALAIALALVARCAQAANVDYSDNGKSWETTGSTCKDGKRQSPIDLPLTGIEAEEEEEFFAHYENVVPVSWASGYGKIDWSTKSSAVYLQLDDTSLAEPPTIEPKSPTYFATPNYFKSSGGLK